MQKMLSEPAKRRHGCFSVFVLVFYFECAKAEIKRCLISVSFLLYGNHGAHAQHCLGYFGRSYTEKFRQLRAGAGLPSKQIAMG